MSTDEAEMRKKPRRMGIEEGERPMDVYTEESPAKHGLQSTRPRETLLALKKPASQTHSSEEVAPSTLMVAWSRPAPISQLIGFGEPPGQ